MPLFLEDISQYRVFKRYRLHCGSQKSDQFFHRCQVSLIIFVLEKQSQKSRLIAERFMPVVFNFWFLDTELNEIMLNKSTIKIGFLKPKSMKFLKYLIVQQSVNNNKNLIHRPRWWLEQRTL
jgi:hypothetical protein